jgi:hypothetical protein
VVDFPWREDGSCFILKLLMLIIEHLESFDRALTSKDLERVLVSLTTTVYGTSKFTLQVSVQLGSHLDPAGSGASGDKRRQWGGSPALPNTKSNSGKNTL